jgi:hypothetical protein
MRTSDYISGVGSVAYNNSLDKRMPKPSFEPKT